MNSFLAIFIFNLYSHPIIKSELPREWVCYSASQNSDSIILSRFKFEFLNDTLIKSTEVDSSSLTGQVSNYESYWGLNKYGNILFQSTTSNEDSTSKNFNKFIYENGNLKRIARLRSGILTGSSQFDYENNILVQRTDKIVGEVDSTKSTYYTENGKIVSITEEFGSLKYRSTFTYQREAVVQKDREVLAGPGSPSMEKYYYENGRLIKSEDYDINRLTLFWTFHYTNGMAISPIVSKDYFYRGIKTIDILGRPITPKNDILPFFIFKK